MNIRATVISVIFATIIWNARGKKPATSSGVTTAPNAGQQSPGGVPPGAGAGGVPPGAGAGAVPPGAGAGAVPPGAGAGAVPPGAGAGAVPPGAGAGAVAGAGGALGAVPPPVDPAVLLAQKSAAAAAISQHPNATEEDIEAVWAAPSDVKIPPGADIPQRRLGNTKYTIFRRIMSWFRARENCRKRSMILATFPTSQSYDEVAKLIFDFSVYDETLTEEFLGARRYWIGLSDLGGEGEWRWFDTGVLLTYDDKWALGQPDHIGQPPYLTHDIRRQKPDGSNDAPEHCGVMWNPTFGTNDSAHRSMHVWDDSLCIGEEKYYYFICEDFHEPTGHYLIPAGMQNQNPNGVPGNGQPGGAPTAPPPRLPTAPPPFK